MKKHMRSKSHPEVALCGRAIEGAAYANDHDGWKDFHDEKDRRCADCYASWPKEATRESPLVNKDGKPIVHMASGYSSENRALCGTDTGIFRTYGWRRWDDLGGTRQPCEKCDRIWRAILGAELGEEFEPRNKPAASEPSNTASAFDLISAVRQKHFAKGFNAAHDDLHTGGQLGQAALCLLSNYMARWPWDDNDAPRFSDTDEGHQARLVAAAALLCAEIERRERQRAAREKENQKILARREALAAWANLISAEKGTDGFSVNEVEDYESRVIAVIKRAGGLHVLMNEKEFK